jgi:hypothetical protein
MLRPEDFAVAPVVVAADDHRIQRPGFESVEQRPCVVEQQLDGQRGIERFQSRQHERHLRPHHMRRDAEPEASPRRGQAGERAGMRGEEFARRREERLALRRQPHLPRRSLDQPGAEPVLQPLELDAHRPLRRPQRFGGAGEAAVVRDRQEHADAIDFQSHYNSIQICCH